VGAVAAVAMAQRSGAPVALSGGADKVARVWDIAGAVRAAAVAHAEAYAAAGVDPADLDADHAAIHVAVVPLVGRCRLTVSKPVLKAPMVSALE